jgi:Fe-S cluster assembly protein SufD
MTTTTSNAPKENVLSIFVPTQVIENELATEAKAQALHALTNLDVPNTKWEEWKYTSLREISKREYSIAENNKSKHLGMCNIPNFDAHAFVFVNGIFHSDCLNKEKDANLICKNIQNLDSKEQIIFEEYFAKYVKPEKDIFSALNTAYCQNGIFLYVPDNVNIELPIHIQHLTDSETNISFQHRNLFIVGKNSNVKIVETYHGTGIGYSLRNAVTELVISENANVEYVKVQTESDKSSHIESTVISQAKDSRSRIYTISVKGEILRNNLTINLEGSNIESYLSGAYLLSGNQHVDNHTEVHHKMPHCYSNELYKGILADTSTGVFNGKIHVYRDAQKTNAYQSNKNILLSDEANVYTKPQLEIYADDVKCSHGATTGQMNEEALFYMQARGIKKHDAQKLLVNAFATEVTENITMEAVKEYINDLILNRF